MGKKGLKCLLFVLVIFGGTYLTLSMVYKLGTLATIIAGLVLSVLGVGFLFGSISVTGRARRAYYGIFSGLFLWGVLGEVIERLGILAIADWQMFPILAFFTFLIVLFGIKKYLPAGLMFSLGHFNAIWFLHFIMINQFELMSRTSWVTYASCALFFLLAIFFGVKMTRAENISKNMAYSLALLLTSWTVLEYLWGWRILPGPWMIH